MEQLLGQTDVDLADRVRRYCFPVAPRIVDVDVESVLVGDVLVDLAPAAQTEVSDDHTWSFRVGSAVLRDHAHEEPYQPVGAVEPVRPVRHAVAHWIPCDPVLTLDRQADTVDEAPCMR